MIKAAPGSERKKAGYPRSDASEARRIVNIREAARRMREGGGFLYLAEVIGTDLVKIGYALDLEKRVRSLKQDYFVDVRMIGSMPATIMDEKTLHRRLRKFCKVRWASGRASEFYPRGIVLHPAVPVALLGAT